MAITGLTGYYPILPLNSLRWMWLLLPVDQPMNGGAGSGDDFDFTSPQTLTFNAGGTSQEVIVDFNNDNVYEGSETINFHIQNPSNASVDAANDDHVVTITDDEGKPTIQFAAANTNDSEATTPHVINVTLSGPAEAAVSADIVMQSSAGTAMAGTDFTAFAPHTVNFAALDVSEDLSIVIANDTIDEANETINIEISSGTISSNAQAGSQQVHAHTINDNDDPPEINFALGLSSQIEDNANKDIVVDLNHASSSAITVDYRLRVTGGAGTATAATDYTFTAGTLSFAAGELSKTFQVSVIEDTIAEGDETVIWNY